MGYNVVLRRNGAKVGHFGPFTTKKQAIAQGQVLADDAARDVVVSVEPQRKRATTKRKRANTRRTRANGKFKIGDLVKVEGSTLDGAEGIVIEFVTTTKGEPGVVLELTKAARRKLFGQATDEVIALSKHLTKKRVNTRRANPTVPDVWGLPPKYGSKVVPPGDYKTLPLPARMGTHSKLYYEARSPQGGVANLMVEKKGRDRYYLSGGSRSQTVNGKEAREMIKHFLKNGRLPARSNPSRGTFKSKTYAYYTVANGKLTSGHSTRKAALEQAGGRKANVKTAKQAQKYLKGRSLTSSASWHNQPRKNPARTRSNPVGPGQKFVIVDTSVPGGKWVDGVIYDGTAKADREAEKLWKRGRKVQVIDAVWFKPSAERLRVTGLR